MISIEAYRAAIGRFYGRARKMNKSHVSFGKKKGKKRRKKRKTFMASNVHVNNMKTRKAYGLICSLIHIISWLSLICICSLILITDSKIFFWILGIGIGLFIGGLQSTSRTCMARLSKANDQSKMFGIYGLSGKITAFLGPYFVALLTTTFNNQKAGFVSIIVFFILGYLIIRNLKLPNYSTSK